MDRINVGPVIAFYSALLLITLLSSCSGGVPTLAVGNNWIVEKTTQTQSLTIPEGAIITAPAGKSVTMTVDGVETDIAPGTYSGKVTFTVTDDILVRYSSDLEHQFRAALYVADGKIVPAKSVTAALVGGKVSDTSADDVAITSNGEKFNGILVTGNSKYTITHPTIKLTGNGGNDFAGFGAAIMATGNADVTVDDATIINHGVVRTAVFVGGNATVHMNNCNIEVYNGTLPADYKWNVDPGKMMEVPWMMGLSGNARATNLVDSGTVYYNNCHLKSQGWGVMSTDAAKKVRMVVTHSTIETTDSGYGAYAIGDTVDSFSASTFNVADIGLIIGAEGSATFTDGTKLNSGRFGVMMHAGVGGGTLTIEKGSVFNTKSTAIQVKGRGTTIIVDNAQLNPANGILVEAMPNDDPLGGPPPRGAAPAAAGGAAKAIFSLDVVATLRNAALKGDLINARSAQGDMRVTLEKASLAGVITTAVASPSTGQKPTEQTRRLIGEVKNAFGPTTDKKNGAQVTVDGGSAWTVTQTSYLTQLTLQNGGKIAAPAGKHLVLTVNGAVKPLNAGTYAGKIVLRVN